MWFKNLQVYRFTRPFEWDNETLLQKLEARAFKPCFGQDLQSVGWVPPLGKNGVELTHVTNGYTMLSMKRQEKVLPAAVVNDALDEHIETVELEEGRRVVGKEKQRLKDEIIFTLIPKAFTRSSVLYAFIDPTAEYLIINAASASRAEELISCLRDCVGRLSLIPLASKNVPVQSMTEWLSQSHEPEKFEFGFDCELRGVGQEPAVIRFKDQDLKAKELIAHLETGMQVSKLALTWVNGIECVIDEQLSIKRLKFSDIIQDKTDDTTVDDAADQFDLDFSVMAPELVGFIKDLLGVLGGVSDEYDPAEEDE